MSGKAFEIKLQYDHFVDFPRFSKNKKQGIRENKAKTAGIC